MRADRIALGVDRLQNFDATVTKYLPLLFRVALRRLGNHEDGSNDVHPSVVQAMLRHSKQQTTARYIHPVNSSQLEAQGLYLDAIKIRGKRKIALRTRRHRVESRVGAERRKRG